MKLILRSLLFSLTVVALPANAQTFSSGSDGSLGALIVIGNTNIVVPTNGILNFTTVSIQGNRVVTTVTFKRNDANTPVYILAQGPISIAGTILLSGLTGNNVIGGLGGPGGFDGGSPGSLSVPPGAGYGPGAGKGGLNSNSAEGAGGGAYAGVAGGASTNKGAVCGGRDLNRAKRPV